MSPRSFRASISPFMTVFFLATLYVGSLQSACAQSYLFDALAPFGDTNGWFPNSGVTFSEDSQGSFLGTTVEGGAYSVGTIFRYIPATGQLLPLYTFTGGNDGANPVGGVVLDSQGNLYGVTSNHGNTNLGTIFEYSPATGKLTTLYTFTGGSDGNQPNGVILDSKGNLYGTTYPNGNGYGTVFEFSPSTNQLTTLYTFTGGSDGADPTSGLTFDDQGNLYGTTSQGGTTAPNTLGGFGFGTLFQYSLSTGQRTTLYTFTGGSDGGDPTGALLYSQGNLYGANDKNAGQTGTLFQYSLSTGQLTTLYTFADGNDGGSPTGNLVIDSQGNLYGTAFVGGDMGAGAGTVFAYSTSTNQLTTLYTFTNGNDGGSPVAGVALDSQGDLYGTAWGGGANDRGTIFVLAKNGYYLVMQNVVTGDTYQWLMSGAERLEQGEIQAGVQSGWKIVGTGDFNGDGNQDILWYNTDTREVGYWQMDGAQFVQYVQIEPPGVVQPGWLACGAGDISGAGGKPNILWQNTATGEIGYWTLTSSAQFSSYTQIEPPGVVPTSWQAEGMPNFSGGSAPNILWQNTATGEIGYWTLNNGQWAGYTQMEPPGAVSTSWHAVATPDINGTGSSDVVWQNLSTGEIGYWTVQNGQWAGYTQILLPGAFSTNWQLGGSL